MSEKQPTMTPFEPQELALIMSFAYTTMEVVKDHPDRLEEMLDPENGLTMELFERTLGKLTLMRLVAGLIKTAIQQDEDDAGDDLASMKPEGHA